MSNVIEKTLVLSANKNRYEELDENIPWGSIPWVCSFILKTEFNIDSLPQKITVRASDEPFEGATRFNVGAYEGFDGILYFTINDMYNTYGSIQVLLENWGYIQKIIGELSVPLYVRFSNFE